MSRTKTVTSSAKSPSGSLFARKSTKSVAGARTPARTRFRPGALALKEIRKYQKSSDLLIRRRPFQRLVRALVGSNEIRFQSAALLIFQEALENFATGLLEDSYRCAVHAKRVTLMPRDILLIYKLKYSRQLALKDV